MNVFAPQLSARDGIRRVINGLMCGILALSALLAIAPLLSVFFYIVKQGVHSLQWSFLSELPKPVGETGGGIGNAIMGTGILIATASAIGIPWGVLVGVFLGEHANRRLAIWVRFVVDLLASVPSIVIGIFVYSIIVVRVHHFSALAGGVALGMIMIPTVAKTTEELLKLVPVHIREAGLALGLPRWRVILSLVLRGIMGGVFTGIMLAVARVAGETAPLIFTALNNQYWSSRLDQPISSIPVQIYTYAVSPYEDWHAQAWAGALILVTLVLCLNLVTRAVIAKQSVRQGG